MKKVLYQRVSTLNQKHDSQNIKGIDFDLVLSDTCSGTVPLFEREYGVQLKTLVNSAEKFELVILDIDRLGRDTLDLISNIKFFSENGICINIVMRGLKTLLPDGTENPTATLVVQILSVVSDMQRKSIVEKTKLGVKKAKEKGVYTGRKKGTKEGIDKFLNKTKSKEILRLLKKDNTIKDVCGMTGASIGTVMKVKKAMNAI